MEEIDGLLFIDRGSAEWERAWDALHDSGRDREAFMLMHASPSDVEGRLTFSFKHVGTRRYVTVEG